MSAASDAFGAAFGQPAATLSAVIVLIVAAVFCVVVADAALSLWESHQSGGLEGRVTVQHYFRLGVLFVFFLVLMVS